MKQPSLIAIGVAALLAVLPLSAVRVPRPAPELVFKLANGQEMKLSQFKGKVVALEFLLTTCPHCKRTSGVMRKMYAEYGPKGFQALGVAINEGARNLVEPYRAELNLDYPVGYVDRDTAVDFLEHPIMLTMWMPQLVFIDKKGVIRAQYGGTDEFFRNEEQNMREMIEKLLAEK